MAAVDKLTRQMLAGEQMSSVAALARDAPEWARAFVDAAERRVRELDDALASARGDVVKLRARAEQFVAENEQLHERLAAELEREPPVQPPAAPSNDRSVIQGPSQERARGTRGARRHPHGRERARVEQTAVLQAELDRCSTDLDSRARSRARSAMSGKSHGEVAAARKVARASGARRGDVSKGHVQHSTGHGPGPGATRRIEGLTQLHAQNSTLREQLDEKTRTCADLTDRLEADGDELWQRVQAAGARARELQTSLATQTQRGDLEAEKARRAERALEQVRGDNAGMLRVMSGMEKQLASYAQREEGVAQSGRDAKEKAENALLARDKAQAKCDQALRELESDFGRSASRTRRRSRRDVERRWTWRRDGCSRT